jgi:hypothetical protein
MEAIKTTTTSAEAAAAKEPAAAAIEEAAHTAPHLIAADVVDSTVAEVATVPQMLQLQPLGASTASALI